MQSRRLTECCASVVLARQCIARIVVGLTDGVRCVWCHCMSLYQDTQWHQTHLNPSDNPTTTRAIHWRARTTDAQHSVSRRLCIYGLITWSSYTIPDCTCLKLLMMGGCNTRNMKSEEIKWHKILKIVASSWCFHLLIYDARNHETEI
jgi:hypothetical protein